MQPPKELPEIGAKPRPESLESPPLPPAQMRLKEPAPQPAQQAEQPRKELRLPQIDSSALRSRLSAASASQQRKAPSLAEDELKRFEEAINKINIDVIHSETPDEATESEEEGYYKPRQAGEGYFSEIEHYLKNKDVNEIVDDVLKKDFLTDMKDYHDTKAQGKPFYLNKDELKAKLKSKMEQLRALEEEWHSIRSRMEEDERKRRQVEQLIDRESQGLKGIFRQIKVSQWLEKEAQQEHYFKLKSGQELKSLNDLRKALSYIEDEEFFHHVNQERNDFATWALDALQIPELAQKIALAKTKEELQSTLKSPF